MKIQSLQRLKDLEIRVPSSYIIKNEEVYMPKIVPDLVLGSFYGDWELLEEVPRKSEKYYRCKCKCGTIKLVSKSNLRLSKSVSCGKGECKKLAITHGMTDSKIYSVWHGIKYRIKNPIGNNECYKGIQLHPAWEDFQVFLKWACENGYSEGLTIDRIHSNKNYCPENCRWVTPLVQSQNRSGHKSKENALPKGVYKTKPKGKRQYKNTGKNPYYTVVIYNGKRNQRSGFKDVESAVQGRIKLISDLGLDGLVL